jgi:hypothetical protein
MFRAAEESLTLLDGLPFRHMNPTIGATHHACRESRRLSPRQLPRPALEREIEERYRSSVEEDADRHVALIRALA